MTINLADYGPDKAIAHAADYLAQASAFQRAGRPADARYWQSMADALLDAMSTDDAIQAAYLAASTERVKT